MDLGGPGPGCSAMRVRRLEAGELTGAELERTLAHVAECPRCLDVHRELQQEREALRRDVPFPAFASGVAERLAQRPRRSFVSRWAPLAAAAGLLMMAGSAVLLRSDGGGVRSKGAASAQLFVQDARGTRELAAGEPVAQGARLLISLHPAGRKQLAAVLLEPDETSVVYAGPAVNGPLPQAFEWTGSGKAMLLIVLSDRPLDAARIHGRRDVPHGAEAIELPLRR